MNTLGSFAYNASGNTLRAGLKPGSTGTGGGVYTATLAATNTITSATLAIGDVAGSTNGGTSTLHLGSSNYLNVG